MGPDFVLPDLSFSHRERRLFRLFGGDYFVIATLAKHINAEMTDIEPFHADIPIYSMASFVPPSGYECNSYSYCCVSHVLRENTNGSLNMKSIGSDAQHILLIQRFLLASATSRWRLGRTQYTTGQLVICTFNLIHAVQAVSTHVFRRQALLSCVAFFNRAS